jgi:phage tail-like protein
MTTYADRLAALLPEIQRVSDTTGDLTALLRIVGATLDEIDAAIAGLPDLASVDDCPPDFLRWLAGLVGVVYNPLADPAVERRRIREAVERARRRGTIDGMRRDLQALGWSGEIIEAHQAVMRLNTRGTMNQQKLPGDVYNIGIYGVTGVDPDNAAMAAVLDDHQPAGTRRWTEEDE